jgi:hypothetical protein
LGNEKERRGRRHGKVLRKKPGKEFKRDFCNGNDDPVEVWGNVWRES